MKVTSFALTSAFCLIFTLPTGKLFRWKFSHFRVLTFEYKRIESVRATATFNSGSRFNDILIKQGNGQLFVKVKDPTFAEIIIPPLHMRLYSVDFAGDTNLLTIFSRPEIDIQKLSEDGTVHSKMSKETEFLVAMLFPIMKQNVSVGDSLDFPLSIPIHLFDNYVEYVNGHNRIRYLGSKGKLANFESQINTSDSIITFGSKEGGYTYTVQGDAKYEFDFEKGYFTQGFVRIGKGFKTNSSDTSISRQYTNLETRIELRLV